MDELDVSQLLSVQRATEIIDAATVEPRMLRVPLAEAQGLRLAEDVRADRDYPPVDKSLMDGYAVRCADVATAPVELELAGEIAAGQSAAALRPGQAMAIMTGAPLPAGADGVVPVEEASRAEGRVRFTSAARPGRYISRRGSDCATGEVVLRKGTRLESAALAAAASVGAATLTVFDRPRVAVLSTGDEVVPFDQSPTGAQVRNSNSIMLIALLRRLGCDVTDIGHARDEPKVIRERIAAGLEHDVLFVTGGMSMGRYDFVPRILHEMQAEMRITKLRIKPGKPFVFAALPGGPYVFGLPGNPVSGFVCTVRLASRLLARMSGGEAEPRSIEAKLSAALPANGPREFYQPAIFRGGEVEPLAWKGSADMFTLARANVLLVRAENEPALEMGSVVRVLEIPS